jgi:uncharacterized protein YbaP (TraB family)
MKKILLLFVVLISAQYAKPQLFWEVTGKGIKKSYIFGTNHLVSAKFLASVPDVYKAYNSTQTVVGEILMSTANLADTIMQYAAMPQGVTCKDLLSPQDYYFADSVLQKNLSITLSSLAQLKPAMISTIYTQWLFEKMFGENEEYLDSYFQRVAENTGKEVLALETVLEQSRLLFGSQTVEEQAKMLVETLKDSTKAVDEIRQLVADYKSGNLNLLLEYFENDTTDFLTPEAKRQFTDNRNKIWADKLSNIFKQKSAFVAVGALHLAGKNGLIELLRKRGFNLKTVKTGKK